MNCKIDAARIPFSQFQIIQRFEDEISDKIKSLLNEQYPHISVKLVMNLDSWDGRPVTLKHNASSEIAKSHALISKIIDYLSTRDDIESIIANNYSIILNLTLTQKEIKTENMPKEDTITFIPVSPKHHFGKIVLNDDVKKEIFDALKVLECKDLIYNEWGFSEVDSVPRSVLNFYGEPGTGKTMCAHAIANHLGKKILLLNYSEIESKYVGEAPKNLQKAFEVAQESDSVLFFDEADSFLGRRIENVTQGADQALNSLRSQMLILLEQFSGVVLFATNLVTNFDPAFESRILKHIRFELPDQKTRAAIIKTMIPSKLPVVSAFTEEQYMEASSLIDGFSGREIKGAVLDMILSKADPNNPNVVFTIDDLLGAMEKKQSEKKALNAESERKLKEKIERKIKEKAAEAEAIKKAQENNEDGEVINEDNQSSAIHQE